MTTATTETHELMTEAEAARYTRMAVPTLQTWRCRGRGPAFIQCGRAVRYTKAELNRWLESRTVRPGAAD